MALTISTGFVVDDAIVMIENIARYIEAGDAPLAAALKGSQQIGFTIISLTVSLIAALIPLLFMGEIVGRLFHEFAITLAVTIVISAAVSLTLVPMLCARLLHHRPAAARGAWDLRAEQGFQWIIGQYERALAWVLDRQGLTLAVAGLTLVVTLLLYVFIPKGLLSRAGHGRDPGHLRGGADHLLSRHGGAAAGAGRRHPQGPGRRIVELLHRRRRHELDPEQRAAS